MATGHPSERDAALSGAKVIRVGRLGSNLGGLLLSFQDAHDGDANHTGPQRPAAESIERAHLAGQGHLFQVRARCEYQSQVMPKEGIRQGRRYDKQGSNDDEDYGDDWFHV